MGVYWRSYAGIISTEAEVIKQLIEEAANIYNVHELVSKGSEEVTNVYDLTIDANCILLHSNGYGCYGTDFEDARMMLFEFLFENYDKALVCFEMVEPCQSQGYCFNASWSKPDGEVDWDDDETFYIHRRVLLEDSDEDEGEFDIADIWFLSFEYLESHRDTLPNLTKLVNLAKETGFTNWAINPTGYDSDELGILIETLWEISDYLEEQLDDYDENLYYEAEFEVKQDCIESLSDIEIDDAEFELPFKLPENFYELITTFRKKVRGYLQESNNNSNERLDTHNGLTLRLRTKNDLMELLQSGKSIAWKVAKGKEKQISHVQIFNWDGSMMLEASHDVSNSYRRSEDNRLVVALNSKDAKIIKCDPPLQWIGQNPVNYVNESSVTPKHNLVEDKINEKNSELVATQTEIEEPAPYAPDGFSHLSPQIAELCESVYEEPVRLIHWQMNNDNNKEQFSILFRECRRGWYFQMLLTQNKDKWSSEYRVLPSFLNLLEPDETIWMKLTKLATPEDWYALDEIFLNTLIFPGNKVMFAGSDLVGEEVADKALENFGFYVPDEEMLPVLLFEATNFGVNLISYFRHPDGFAKENMVSDHNTEECEVYESLTEAQQRLDQKLSYYMNES